MTNFEEALASTPASAFIGVISLPTSRQHQSLFKKPKLCSCWCNCVGEVEFSSGRRDAARQVTCAVKASDKAKVEFFCPTHTCRLKEKT